MNVNICPEPKRAIGCQWLFCNKREPKGALITLKLRLFTKKLTQNPGADGYETLGSVAFKNPIDDAYVIAVDHNLLIGNADVNTAFLHGLLEKNQHGPAIWISTKHFTVQGTLPFL